MKGTRPLDNDEIIRVSACFTVTFEIRNRGLFMRTYQRVVEPNDQV